MHIHPGGEEPTEDEITALTKARDECKSAKDAQEKFDNMHRYSKVVGAGPKGPAHIRGSHVANEDPIAGYRPDFDIYKNNDWARRTQILNRFKSAVRSIVVQRRAMYRLSKVKELVNMVGGSKQKVLNMIYKQVRPCLICLHNPYIDSSTHQEPHILTHLRIKSPIY
jgi:hypothetical protein